MSGSWFVVSGSSRLLLLVRVLQPTADSVGNGTCTVYLVVRTFSTQRRALARRVSLLCEYSLLPFRALCALAFLGRTGHTLVTPSPKPACSGLLFLVVSSCLESCIQVVFAYSSHLGRRNSIFSVLVQCNATRTSPIVILTAHCPPARYLS
jgi:hypothetical protein